MPICNPLEKLRREVVGVAVGRVSVRKGQETETGRETGGITTEGHQLCLGKSLIKDVTAKWGHFKTNRSLLEEHPGFKK